MLKYQIILSGPEIILYHSQFSVLLRDAEFMCNFIACIIDKALCIPQWGGSDFRPTYLELGRFRSHFPDGCPFLATTATATPSDIQFISRILHFSLHSTYYANIGNDRPNICQTVKIIRSPNSFSEIKQILDHIEAEGTWPRTMIFGNTVKDVIRIKKLLWQCYPGRERQIDSYFAL